jgi:two-component system NtrC family sensor kinase
VSEKLIEIILEGATRIEGVTSALDSHARPAEAGNTSASDVREGLDSTVRLLGHRTENVTVHRDFKTDRLTSVPAGPMNQVFLNLLDNAVRAGADNIWLRVQDEEDGLLVTVSDDGSGVQQQDADRIFDPFYSKRKDGTGTGLGLYLSRRMVEEHGGTLTVDRRSLGGAVFSIRIPSVSGFVANDPSQELPRTPA